MDWECVSLTKGCSRDVRSQPLDPVIVSYKEEVCLHRFKLKIWKWGA